MSTSVTEKRPANDCRPKFEFCLEIEGESHPWPVSTVTTEQIAELGGWDPSVGVIQIDAANNERTLEPGEVVRVEPGMCFAKNIRWRRG